MTRFPPYDEYAECAKCGHFDSSTAYKSGEVWDAPGSVTLLYESPEHLLRTCRRCGFQWKEAPLDSPKDPT